MGERLLEGAVLIAGEARKEVKALFGAGGGAIQEARGFGVLGVGVEVFEVLVGAVLVGAGFLDGGEKQPPRTPLVRGAGTDHLFPKKQRRVAAAGAAAEAGDNLEVDIEALG